MNAGVEARGGNGRFHQCNTFKQHAEAHDDAANMFDKGLAHKQKQHRTDEQNQRCIGADIKSGDLCSNGSADICTQNNTDGLGQVQQSGIDKTNDHHICGRRTLDQYRNRNTDKHRDTFIPGGVLQY